VAPFLAMSNLYKRPNGLWHPLIRRRLTGLAWRQRVEWTRRRPWRFRRRPATRSEPAPHPAACVVTAGV
jgi:hypothetical protein